jgi:hypothetical protein
MHVDERGARAAQTDSVEKVLAFDQWNKSACEHADGVLIHHCIGNIAMVGWLREVLSRTPDVFPITLARIVQNGVHCGDFIAADQVSALKGELQALSELHFHDAADEESIRHFGAKLHDLVEAALRVGKPISF